MALAALSSPSAAALLGQSPVPEAVAERAMRDAAAALAADRTGGLAGLALLLACVFHLLQEEVNDQARFQLADRARKLPQVRLEVGVDVLDIPTALQAPGLE